MCVYLFIVELWQHVLVGHIEVTLVCLLLSFCVFQDYYRDCCICIILKIFCY